MRLRDALLRLNQKTFGFVGAYGGWRDRQR